MKTVLITGASGFVGKHLAKEFLQREWRVIGLGTSAAHVFETEYELFSWVAADTTHAGDWQAHVAEADIVVNLAGRSIFKPWTTAYKQAIYDSRVLTTRNVVAALPDGWAGQILSASAVGYYGDRGDTLLSETDACGDDFLASVCRDWEAAAQQAREKGGRVAVMRFGVVLGHGGALTVMGRAFKSFAGGPLGSGRQWFPWIHLSDLCRGILFLVDSETDGTFNFSGPVPLRQGEFARALGRALGRPAFMPAPAFMVKLIMGELGKSLLQSQRALPSGLRDLGFGFHYETAGQALEEIFTASAEKNQEKR